VDGLDPQAERCPECGLYLSAANVVKGLRHRRPRLTAAGVALVVLGVAVSGLSLSPDFRRINWYAYHPTSWLIDDVAREPAARRERAWEELRRRLAARELSDRQEAALDAAAVRGVATIPDGLFGRLLLERFERLGEADQDAIVDRLAADVASDRVASHAASFWRLNDLRAAGVLSPAQRERASAAMNRADSPR
jgi:hypothetical protein